MKIRLQRFLLLLLPVVFIYATAWSNTPYPPKSIHPFLNYALLTQPGGISADLALWLRADQGVVLNSGDIAQWTDQSVSGANAFQNTVADRPSQNLGDRNLNFNPSVYFNADHLQVPLDISANTMGEVTLFVVAQGDGSNHTLMGNQSGSSGNYYRHMALHRTHRGNNNFYDYPTYSTTSPQITRINYRGVGSSGSATSYVSINHAATTSFSESLGAGSLTSFFLGKAGSVNGTYGGHIAEVVVYAKSTSPAENDKIETYLSLKYGIPLGDPQTSDYISSTGTILWDASVHVGYHHDVMGLGRDDGSGLQQKITRPSSLSSINVMLSLENDFSSPNTSLARTISCTNDQTFLLLGHNNQSLSFTNTQISSAFTGRISRVWKASVTGAHPSVTMYFEGLPTTNGPIHLLASPDADFSSGYTDLGAIDLSSKTMTSVNLSDGTYYTLATSGFDPSLTNFVDQTTQYGEADTVDPPTSSGTGAWSYSSSDPSVASIHPTTGVLTTLQVGQSIITATQANDGVYAQSSITKVLTVQPKSLTISVDHTTKVYDGTPHSVFSVQYSGFVSGEGADDLGGTLEFSGEATTSVNVGNYTLTPQGYTSINYLIDYVSGLVSITPLAVTVTPDALTKTYGTDDPILTYSLSATSSTTLTTTGSLTRVAGENVGDYTIALGTLTNTNYTLSLAPENFSITPLAVSVTPDALTKTYGTSDSTLTYSLSATSSATLTITGSLTRVVGEDVGDYAIALGTLTNTNYTLSLAPENFRITPLAVTVTPAALSKTYGDDDPALTYTLSATSSATLTATGSLSRILGEDVGEYMIGLGSLSNPNYAFSLTEVDLSIVAKTLTVTVLDLEKTYDGEIAAGFEVGYVGFVFGEDERDLSGVLDFSGPGLTAVDVGEYEVVARGWSSVNYRVVYQSGTLSISPLNVVVLPDRLSKTYGEDDPEFTYTLSAEGVDGLALEVEGSLARELGESVGAYGLSLGTLAEENYSLVLELVEFEILPATLFVTVADHAHEYDGNSVDTFSVRVDGFVGEEDQDVLTGDLVFGGEAVGAVAVGNYGITASGWQANNYLIQYIPGVLTISGVAVTVVPVLGQQKTYGTPDPVITYTLVPSVVGGVPVDIHGALSREVGEQVGEYAILMGSLSSVQATLVLDPAFFAVQPRILDVQVLDDAKLVTTADVIGYRGVAIEGFAPGESAEVVTGNLSIERSNSEVETPGIYLGVLVASGLSADNYLMNYRAGDYTIVPADQLLLVCSPASWDYGGDLAIEVEEAKYLSELQQEVVVLNNPVYEPQINRFVFDDGAGGRAVFGLAWKDGLLSSSGALASGIYQAIPTDISVTSDNFSNVITVVGATQVYPKLIELSVAHPQKVYDGTTEIGPLDLSLVGVRPLDEVQLLGSASFEDIHVGNEKKYVISDIGLTGMDATNYRLPVWGDWVSDQGVIRPLPVSVNVSGTFSKTYGAEDPLWDWHFFPDEVAGQSLDVEGAPARESGENAGTYSIGLGTLAHPDLVFSLEPQDFVIEPALLEVNVLGGQKQYDGSPYADLQVAVSGFVLDEDLDDLSGTLVFTGPGVSAVETGTYLVSATGWINPNYQIKYRSSEVRIVRSFIQVYPIEGQFLTYGDQEPTWKYRVDPEFIEGKEVILSGKLGREPGDLVGTYIFNLGNLSYPDYALELSPVKMQITPKSLSVIGVKAKDKIYDGVVSAQLDLSELVWSGLVEEMPGEFSVAGNWLDSDAGIAKPVHLDWQLSPWWSERYTVLLPTEITASITPAPLEVIPVPHQYKVYGSQEPVWQYVTRPDRVDLSGQLSRAEGTQVGLYPFDLGTLTHPNYSLSLGYFNAQIVPAPLKVRALDGFYAYDGKPFYGDFGFEIDGLLEDDPLPKVEISGSSQGSSGIGMYTLMPRLGTWPNYEVTLIPGKLTIGHHPNRVEVSVVLTPNSGTAEAVWTITHIDQYPNNQVRIYNKNQQLVWSQTGYRNTWQGIDLKTYRPLPAAPYYYVIDLGEGTPPIQGWLYLTY